MGCWNGTCGISNLPITAGTPIRVVLIVGHDYTLTTTSSRLDNRRL